MRATIIPAQITTVEDKIAGSLNFTQIVLLMVPVLWGTLIFAVLTPAMKISISKIGLVLIVTTVCLVLSIRVKDKIVADWLRILLRYTLRPKYSLSDKNDLTERSIDLPVLSSAKATHKTPVKAQKKPSSEPTVSDLIRLEQVLNSKVLAVSYRLVKKV